VFYVKVYTFHNNTSGRKLYKIFLWQRLIQNLAIHILSQSKTFKTLCAAFSARVRELKWWIRPLVREMLRATFCRRKHVQPPHTALMLPDEEDSPFYWVIIIVCIARSAWHVWCSRCRSTPALCRGRGGGSSARRGTAESQLLQCLDIFKYIKIKILHQMKRTKYLCCIETFAH